MPDFDKPAPYPDTGASSSGLDSGFRRNDET